MRKFKTESKKLLDLMVNSIYTNQEIFLRELISNASDAVDKLYFKSLTDSNVAIAKDDLAIHVSCDKDARTITVSDTGIGMTADELEKNLGTIAHSGSLDFKSENGDAQGDDIDIIGQFGVGFYSSFMVAKHVRVTSKAYGSDEANVWESDGLEGYTISAGEKETHGTEIVLTLKDDTEEVSYTRFLNTSTLEGLIKRYSNYVRYPIQMELPHRMEKPRPEDAGDDYKPEYETQYTTDTVNSMIPIWKRSKSDVTEEEYNEFYKAEFHDFADPARVTTIRAEGALSYDALLFIPSRAPYDLYSSDFKKGLALYSSNVLIMEKCEDLLPDYYGFVRGVVDSQDLSLNISRETLQQNHQLRAIANKIEKKIKSELVSMRNNDREAYETFFENFGRGLKYGIYTSYGMLNSQLGDLLLFYSAKQEKMVTLDEYLEACPVDQKAIYFAAGESTDLLAKTPAVASVLSKGFDVLLCTQDVDEFCLISMGKWGEGDAAKPLKNVAGGDLDLETEAEKAAADAAVKENGELFNALKAALGDNVASVVASKRAIEVPACVTSQGPVSLQMEYMLRHQPGADETRTLRVLELNVNHPVFDKLRDAFTAGETEKVDTYAQVLYGQALLIEGLPLDDPIAYTEAVTKLL